MLSGECRIDAIPVNGQALLIDGLRLRLDLRLMPSSAAATACDPKQWTASALLPRRVQRLAAIAGAGALLSALAFWFAGGTPASHESGAPLATRHPAAPQVASPPLAAPPPAPAAPPSAARAPAPTAGEVPVPKVVPGTPEVRPILEPRARREQPRAAADRPAPPVAKSRSASRAFLPQPPAARPPAKDREMLDLFGDPK